LFYLEALISEVVQIRKRNTLLGIARKYSGNESDAVPGMVQDAECSWLAWNVQETDIV